MNRCSILFVGKQPNQVHQCTALRLNGFLVSDVEDLPASADLANHHVVIVCPPDSATLPKLAARLRAAPRFGRRLLIALVAPADCERVRRDGVLSGFDEVLPHSIPGRQLVATVVEKLRGVPELRCLLEPPSRRPAA